jgi:hypothetical protein
MKLHLDAVVIQQGRLSQQSKNLTKDELMEALRFGADQVRVCSSILMARVTSLCCQSSMCVVWCMCEYVS